MGYKDMNGKETGVPFSSANQPKNRGRKPSIDKEIVNLLNGDGLMVVKKNDIVRTHEDGSVTIKIPKKEAVAMRLFGLAMSGKGSTALRALQILIERVDGKAGSEVEDNTNATSTLVLNINTGNTKPLPDNEDDIVDDDGLKA